MALKICPECEKNFSDKAKRCPHCGFPIKTPGKGFGTTSLVLGIISCVYSLPAVNTEMYLPSTGSTIPNFFYIYYISVIAILSLVFGIISHKNGCKLGRKTAGIVLSIVSLAILTISLILTIFKGV